MMDSLRSPQADAPAPRPDWSQAPTWAQWWAQDATGAAFWYERKPSMYHDEGWACGGRATLAYLPGTNWRETLQQRPGQEPV